MQARFCLRPRDRSSRFCRAPGVGRTPPATVGDSMVSNKLLKQLWTIAPRHFDSGRRPWELGLPAICRAPAVESDGSVGQAHRVHRLCWRFAPDRRQANSHALRAEAGGHLRACGQKQWPPVAPLAFDSGQRPWELGLPAICRAPAVESDGSVGQAHSVHRVCWRFAPDRWQAELPRPSGRSGRPLTGCGQK